MALQQLDFASQGLPADADVRALSVISSTKIRHRVDAALKLLKQENAKDQTTIVALSAKSSTANKLISIVEIIKREIAKERGNVEEKPKRDSAVLFQYSVIRGIFEDLDALDAIRRQNEQARNEALSKKRKRETDASQSTDAQPPNKKRHMIEEADRSTVDKVADVDGPTEVVRPEEGAPNDEYFETLQTTGQAAQDIVAKLEGKSRKPTAVLTIFLSRKPIQALCDAHGEQWV